MYLFNIWHQKIIYISHYDHTFEPILPIAKIIITIYNSLKYSYYIYYTLS